MRFFHLLFILLFASACSESEPTSFKPEEHQQNTYIGKQACKECHLNQFHEWETSHHSHSMLEATNENVLANFSGTFEADGINYTFLEGTPNQVVITEENVTDTFEVAYTFGWEPLQQYLLKSHKGRYQTMRASWNTEKQIWFHQSAGQIIEPHDWLSWSKGGQNWNTMCSSCHSTNVHKNYDVPSDSFNTTYSEVNVSCEACHGMGSLHVEAQSNPKNIDPYKSFSKINEVQVDRCGVCHARRTALADNNHLHDQFLNGYFPQDLNAAYYEPDGQIREEDFVYGSFISSKMYRNHVKCSNCHNPHSGDLLAKGNNLCLQCHENTYVEETHTHHPLNSAGSDCINCHMDGKMYMGNDYRRDHSFRVPRPDQSVQFGTSNACNSCHTDKSAEWATEAVVRWFGKERAYHFSDDLLPGSMGGNQAFGHLKSLLDNDSISGIVKATSIGYLTYSSHPQAAETILAQLTNKNGMVRQSAYSALRYYPEQIRIQFGPIGLADSLKAVRIMAFRSIIGLPVNTLPAQWKDKWYDVQTEYEQYLKSSADFPVGQLNYGEYYQGLGENGKAIESFKRALKMDSLLPNAYSNLAILYSQQNDFLAVNQILNMGVKHFSENPELYYFLGLNDDQMNRPQQQLTHLKQAYVLDKSNTSYAYNYILTEYQKGDKNEAIRTLQEALKTSPNDPRLMELYQYFNQVQGS